VTKPAIDAHGEMHRGLWWMGSATVAMRLLDVGGTLLVLQFLGPGEIGLATLAWSFSVALEAFNGLGVGQVVVRQRELTHAQLSGLFWFCTLLGFAAVAIMMAAGPWLALLYADWRLYPMMVVAAAKLIFVGAALVPLQLLTRDLQFKISGAAQTLATLGEALTKVVLVIAGLGAWGLVLANVARGLALVIALWWLAPFRPVLAVEDAATRAAVRFGLRATLSSVFYNLYRNMDFLLIGKFIGQRAVGIYRVAFDIGMTPLEIVLQLVNRVQFPIYARLRDQTADLRDSFYRSARLLLLILGPITALLFFGSGDLLHLIGGGKWLAAVPLIQVLCWASLLRGISALFPQLYYATGQLWAAVQNSLLTGGVLIAAFVAALVLAPTGQGTMWVAWAWLLSYPIPLANNLAIARRAAPISAGGMGKELLLPLLGIGVISAVLAGAGVLRPLIGQPVIMLALLIGLAFATHFLYLKGVLHISPRDLLPKRAPVAEATDVLP
jgi:O-antigen/teichoic acid export membrane protein